MDPGFENGFADELNDFCKKAGFDLTVYYSDCGTVAHSSINRENPCFLCSRIRRRLLFEAAEKLRCNKVALGHNQDDIIETLFINMCYAGEISTIVPAQSFFKGKFTLIRPLAFVGEDIIGRFAKENNFPLFINPCPTSKTSKRHEIKEFLLTLYKSGRKVKESIFTSMSRVRADRMLKQR